MSTVTISSIICIYMYIVYENSTYLPIFVLTNVKLMVIIGHLHLFNINSKQS